MSSKVSLKPTVKIALVTATTLAFCWPTMAWAYLDPGTGSALIQGVIAAIAAIGLTLKVYWHRVLGFLGLRKSSKVEDEKAPVKTDESGS